ncbi:MAG: hypothetical protein K6T78_09420 [Alicyclobacillus sp.]|nr:hypothetical protein [Alicyclobacillus sp.]
MAERGRRPTLDLSFHSPHQFAPFEPFLDTLILTTYDPAPLDVAVPYRGSLVIAEALAERLVERFHGRATTWAGGDTRFVSPISVEMVTAAVQLRPHPVRFLIVVTDRTLVTDFARFEHSGTACLTVDWWQWFRARVDAHRLCEAWQFLCCAVPEVQHSAALRDRGWTSATVAAMAEQGDRLLRACVDDVAEQVRRLWGDAEPVKDGSANSTA